MNSLYDLCEYGYKPKDIGKLREYGITVDDFYISKKNSNQYYIKAKKIYEKHKGVFEKNSVYELLEYGISISIVQKLKSKVTIEQIKEYSDEYLKKMYDIKYSTISKIRNCGYFNNYDNAIKIIKKNEKKEEIVRLKEYGVTQTIINKIISNHLEIKDILFWNIDEIMMNLDISKATAYKMQCGLENYKIKNHIKNPLNKELCLFLQEKSKYSYISINDIIEYFKDYSEEEIKLTLESLIEKNIINYRDNSYRYTFLNLKEIISKIGNEKLKDMVVLKLQGKSLQEIANKYGITRERVRQIENKFMLNIIVEEDIFRDIVEEYNFNKNEFMLIFDSNEEIYEYLKCKYEFGEKTIEEFLEERPEFVNEEKNEKLLYMNKEVMYNNSKIKLNYTEIIKEYVKKIKNIKSLKEILEELNSDLESLGLQPIDERYLEARLSKLDNVICETGKRYKYLDYITILEDKKTFLKNMINELPDGYYSTLKVFRENEKFFKSINIENEYEVHNLLRKVFSGEITNVTFAMMPSFFVGDIDIEQFFFEIIKEYEPIQIIEFLNIIEERYGHKKAHVRNILKKYFDRYIILDKINIKMIELNNDKIELIKLKLNKDLYNVESFYNVLKHFFGDNYLEYMNNSNLFKLRLSFYRKLYIK